MKVVLHKFLLISCLILFTGCKQPPAPPNFGDLVTSTAVHPTDTSTPTFTLTPNQISVDLSSPTATLIPYPLAQTKQRNICFNGPSELYQPADAILENVLLVILGKSDDDDWFLVEGASRCWIEAANVFYQFDISQIQTLYTAFTTSDSTCRAGPNMQFNEQTYIPRGWRIFVNGKNSVSVEWVLVTPHDSTKQCWVARNLLTTVDYYAIPLVETPTLPPVVIAPTSSGGGSIGKPTSTPTATNTPGPPPPTPTICWPPGWCKDGGSFNTASVKTLVASPTSPTQTIMPNNLITSTPLATLNQISSIDIGATKAKQQFEDAIRSDISIVLPETMKLNGEAILELRLSPYVPGTALVATSIESIGLTPISTDQFINPQGGISKVESDTNIKTTEFMKAELRPLNKDALDVTPLQNEDPQASSANAVWQWSIVAKEKGVQYLLLKIYMLYKVNETEVWTLVESYQRDITVIVKPVDSIKAFDWKMVIGIMLTGLLIPLFFRWYDRRREKSTHQKRAKSVKKQNK